MEYFKFDGLVKSTNIVISDLVGMCNYLFLLDRRVKPSDDGYENLTFYESIKFDGLVKSQDLSYFVTPVMTVRLNLLFTRLSNFLRG